MLIYELSTTAALRDSSSPEILLTGARIPNTRVTNLVSGPGLASGAVSCQSPMAPELLKRGSSKLRWVMCVKYTPEFKGIVQKKKKFRIVQ